MPNSGLDVVVGDDLQLAPDDRQDRGLADQALVALVFRVHRDRDVGEHRLRTDGGDGDRAAARGQRIVDVVERVGDLALLDLEVGDGRAAARIPVDQVAVAVDVALLVEVDEDLQHRLHVGGVEREPLVLEVGGRAQALDLLDDPAAVALAPGPDPGDELLATELLAARAEADELLLDLRLRGDTGVVGAEDPLRALALLTRAADQRVLDRVVERVAHVQHAGDVRRRDRDRVVLGRVALGRRMVQTGVQPLLGDPRLDLGGLIARLHLNFARTHSTPSLGAGRPPKQRRGGHAMRRPLPRRVPRRPV